MHPAVVKAQQIGGIAKRHNWQGKFASNVFGSERHTMLSAIRDDERLEMQWRNQRLTSATYSINSISVEIKSKSELLGFLAGDLIQLFDKFPNMNRPNLVQRFRSLPFSFDDSNDEIIDSLVGKTLWWYDRELATIRTDTVKPKRDKRFRIVDVGHRKLFHCVMVETNFRSILLDQLIKVA